MAQGGGQVSVARCKCEGCIDHDLIEDKVQEIGGRYLKWLKGSGIVAEDAQFMTDIYDLVELVRKSK
jgi:hypothetical protein